MSLKRLNDQQPILWYHEADFWVKLWKKSEEYGFLKDCPAQLLQQKLKDLDKAFRDAFDKNQPLKRLPVWRERGKHDSFRYPQHFKLDNRRIFLPKIGWVSFFKSQAIVGTPKNVTVSYQGGHWYVSIQVEMEQQPQIHPSQSAVGIDLGVSRFAALSDGSDITGVESFKKYEWLGGIFLKVNPKYTSQQCYLCKYIDKDNRVSQSLFQCKSCGHTDNADNNAAKNVLAAGHAVLACGKEALATLVKQEPLRE
jgi:transposase